MSEKAYRTKTRIVIREKNGEKEEIPAGTRLTLTAAKAKTLGDAVVEDKAEDTPDESEDDTGQGDPE